MILIFVCFSYVSNFSKKRYVVQGKLKKMCYHAVRNSDCLFVCKNRTFLVFFCVYLVINLVSLQCFVFRLVFRFTLSFVVRNTYPDLFCVYVACLEWRFCLFPKLRSLLHLLALINVSKRFPLAVTFLFKFLLCCFFVAYTKTALIIFVTVFLYNFLWFLIRLPLTSH